MHGTVINGTHANKADRTTQTEAVILPLARAIDDRKRPNPWYLRSVKDAVTEKRPIGPQILNFQVVSPGRFKIMRIISC